MFVENACKPYYAAKMGTSSLPPGWHFRMHIVGFFERLDGERGVGWRCADSFSLRNFSSSFIARQGFRLFVAVENALASAARGSREGIRLRAEARRQARLVKGARIGVDDSIMKANAALRSIVRRDNGETYRAMLERMATESGIATPSARGFLLRQSLRGDQRLPVWPDNPWREERLASCHSGS